MKKLLCAAVAALCVLPLFATTACSGEAEVEYTLSDDGKYYIVSGVSGDKDALRSVEIPVEYQGDGGTLPVSEIGEKAFYGCTSLTSVTLPSSVSVIGAKAFALCSFSEFTIPDGVETIGDEAFRMCSRLTEITIPYSVTYLGEGAFANCERLESAEVFANITDLKVKTFYNSTPNSGGQSFSASNLTQIFLPATLQKINEYALYGSKLADIYFGGSEEQWGEIYFYYYYEESDGASAEVKLTDAEKEETLSSVEVHFNCAALQG